MDHDLISLMQILSTNSFPTLKDIETTTNATRRQAMYRIEKLNKLLKAENIPAVTVSSAPPREILISEETLAAIKRLLEESSASHAYYFSKKDRLIYMYLLLFINLDYVSLNHFIGSLKCSRSTVLSDLKELKQVLEKDGIELCNNRTRGYYLMDSEIEIRRFMIWEVICTLSDKQNGKIFDAFINDFGLNIFDYSRQVITELAAQWKIRLVEARLLEFIYIFIFLKARMQSGVKADLSLPPMIETDVIPTLKEYAFTKDLLNRYEDTDQITESDIKYITSWILGISYGNINEDTKDNALISGIARNIMQRFEAISGVHLGDSDKMFVQLYAHLRPAYYRLIFHLPIFNPICATVKNEYWELFQLMVETMKPIAVLFNRKIPEDEIAYLTMHFAAAFAEKKNSEETSRKKALVICSNGVGSSTILYNELTRLFPELNFLPPLDSSHAGDSRLGADIIFTTNYTPLAEEPSVPVVRVNPVMSINERRKITHQVYQWLGISSQGQPDVDVVMDIIAKYADIREKDSLYGELTAHFYETQFPDAPEDIKLHLTDMIWPEIISLDLEAATPEEAIRKTYEPMVRQHCVLPSYVEECIRTSTRYMVITKHVALPHAKPEAGAITCGLGIGVLKTPLTFGIPENDPVKYIFALSAVNNSSHLCAMAELIHLFNDQNFYQLLDNAHSSQEVMEYIRDHL